MSDFGNYMAGQIKAQRTTGGEMASRMGIDRTHFSQFLNGRRRSCNVETLMKMVHGISEDPTVRAGFLEAYFRDQCIEDYKSWISVEADPSPMAAALRAEMNPNVRYEIESALKNAKTIVYVSEDAPDTHTPLGELLHTLERLRLPHEVVKALGSIAEYCATQDKFRVVVKDLGRFAAEEVSTIRDTPDRQTPEVEGRQLCPPPKGPVRYQEDKTAEDARTASSGRPSGSLTPAPGESAKRAAKPKETVHVNAQGSRRIRTSLRTRTPAPDAPSGRVGED